MTAPDSPAKGTDADRVACIEKSAFCAGCCALSCCIYVLAPVRFLPRSPFLAIYLIRRRGRPSKKRRERAHHRVEPDQNDVKLRNLYEIRG